MRDKLRLFRILYDRLILAQEYPVKKAQVARISDGGHLIATICRANTIHIYELHRDPKEAWKVLKGHVSVITDLRWTDHDQKIITVSAGGACYTWIVSTGQRIGEQEWERSISTYLFDMDCPRYVDKSCVFTRAIPAQDGSCLLQTTSKTLQWIRNGRRLKELQLSSGSADAPVELIRECETLLYGTEEGKIASRSLTMYGGGDTTADEIDVFPLHRHAIALLRLTRDASFVVTCDVKGIVIVSKLQRVSDGVLTECPHRPRDRAHDYVLLTVEDVLAKAAKEQELQCSILAEKKNAEYMVLKSVTVLCRIRAPRS